MLHVRIVDITALDVLLMLQIGQATKHQVNVHIPGTPLMISGTQKTRHVQKQGQVSGHQRFVVLKAYKPECVCQFTLIEF